MHSARTADGWQLGLRRYRPPGEAFPVVLCPGYGCSGLFLDYDERHSLARHLAGRGFDVWVVDLRGRGASRALPEARARRWSWTFDDFVRYDLPAVVTTVRETAGRKQMAWVGHSMGGAAFYAFAGTSALGRESIAAAVTVASPVLLPTAAGRWFQRLGRFLLHLPFVPSTVPQRRLIPGLWSAVGVAGLLRIGMNPANLDLRVARRAIGRSIHDVSLAKLRQLATWSAEQVFRSVDGSIDYRAGLSRIATPLLAVAGADDRMAAPWSVHLAVEEVDSEDRTYLELGEASGCEADYGHVDLILGHRAPREVFTRIGDWLEARLAGR